MSILHIYCICFLLVGSWVTSLYAQVGIGTTTPDSKALLDLYNNPGQPRGLLLPRVSGTQRTGALQTSLGPAQVGLIVADTSATTGGVYVWHGSGWQRFGELEGGGTANRLALWTATPGRLTNSVIEQVNQNIGIGAVPNTTDRVRIEAVSGQVSALMVNNSNNSIKQLWHASACRKHPLWQLWHI